ncbi:hypothetical protein Tco_1127768 [Tanacetum coccineum]
MICYRQFNTKIARRANMLTDEVMDGLSALVYCRPLDTTTLRELIDSNRRLIVEEPAPSDPRVAICRTFRVYGWHCDVPLQGAYVPPGYDEPQQQHQDEE